MKNDIKKNIILDDGEKIYKEFPKLAGKDYFCQLTLTSKRLIILTESHLINKARRVKKRGMNEIELKSITHMEYYLESIKNSFIARLIGLILFIGSLVLAYGLYRGMIAIPAYPYSEIANYLVLVFLLIIGLILMFQAHKSLYFKTISGFNVNTKLKLKANKYNELALKYIASKFY